MHAIQQAGAATVQTLRRDLAQRIAQFIGEQQVLTTDISGLLLARRTSTSDPAVCVTYEPSIIVVAQGRKQVLLGGETYVYDESRYLLTSIDLPILSQVMVASKAKPFLCLRLKFDMGLVRELAGREETMLQQLPASAAASQALRGMSTGPVTAELLDACCRLVGLLNAPQDAPFLSNLIQREIIYRVLRGPEGARLRAIATLGDQSNRIAKAVAWIRANFAKPLRIEEVAEVAGMGVSTLHHHFRAMTSMSPLQYQKQLRLQWARTRMLVDGLDASSAAFEAGYESASQFNREYSRTFGNPPMRDIKTLRGPLPLTASSAPAAASSPL